MRVKSKGRFKYIYLLLFFVILYLPILSVLLYSFNKSPSTAQFTGFTLQWYRDLLNDKVIINAFIISIQVGIMTAILSAIIGTLTAIIGIYISDNMNKTIKGMMLFPLLVPEVALGIALLLFFSWFNIPFGRITLVIAHSLFCVPYVYIMVSLQLNEISKSVLEAAIDLGATNWHMTKTIIIPLIVPAIVSSSLLALAMSLDDVVISTYMSGPKTTTLPVHIFSMMKTGTTPKINAISTVILVATFTVVGLSQIRFKKEK